MTTFQHPTYTITHICGHSVTKQVLEATEGKRRLAVKAMSEQKCIECITAPTISENIWGDTEVAQQSYYTVYVYKHDGMGNEATYANILAESPEDATERVANSYYYHTNPKYAFKQESRVF
jgi:hypothetical protein